MNAAAPAQAPRRRINHRPGNSLFCPPGSQTRKSAPPCRKEALRRGTLLSMQFSFLGANLTGSCRFNVSIIFVFRNMIHPRKIRPGHCNAFSPEPVDDMSDPPGRLIKKVQFPGQAMPAAAWFIRPRETYQGNNKFIGSCSDCCVKQFPISGESLPGKRVPGFAGTIPAARGNLPAARNLQESRIWRPP